MPAVEVIGIALQNEELGSPRIGLATIGQGEHASEVGGGAEFIGQAEARPALAIIRRIEVPGIRISTLDHEIRDHAVKTRPVVEARIHQVEKALNGSGSQLRV